MQSRALLSVAVVVCAAGAAGAQPAAGDDVLRSWSEAASRCAPQLYACNLGDRSAVLDTDDCHSAHGRPFDLYSFGARAGEMITVSLGSQRFGGFVALVDPDGRIVQQSEVKLGDHAFVALQAPEDGVYDVIASTSAAGVEGDYRVSVACLPVEAPDFTPCDGEDELCLGDGRFRVETWWQTADGETGRGSGEAVSDDTGWFWFFREGTAEVMVKALEGCTVNGHNWVFAAGLTDVHTAIRVTDTRARETVWYFNPQRTPFRAVQDTAALATCG
ncbi:MAG TPA: hypothetical protein VHM02_03520 [Thermoanaerobaculia bacterium]|nr:hypothetical protein [Thermoanaerobaculia bacterium]